MGPHTEDTLKLMGEIRDRMRQILKAGASSDAKDVLDLSDALKNVADTIPTIRALNDERPSISGA